MPFPIDFKKQGLERNGTNIFCQLSLEMKPDIICRANSDLEDNHGKNEEHIPLDSLPCLRR